MAYIGREPQIGNFQVCDAISVVNGQAAYTMQVSSVNVSPETANHMLVSLNGVLQKPGSSYTVSGSTITFASNLVTGDVINFIHILGSVLDLGVPSNDTVGAAQIKDDLISGTTALASEPADTDEFLVSDAGTLKRIDYSLIKGGGITMADQWRLSANVTLATSVTIISSNWERVDTDGYGVIGSSMSESSGIFTFPSTGIYYITFKMAGNGGSTDYVGARIDTTLDNSSYDIATDGYQSTSGSGDYYIANISFVFDVTNTTTHKIRFRAFTQTGTVVANGNTDNSATVATFIRLGDT